MKAGLVPWRFYLERNPRNDSTDEIPTILLVLFQAGMRLVSVMLLSVAIVRL